MAGERGIVLIIDDEEPVREVLQRFLTRAGYEVRAAANGQEALQMVHSQSPPDLIVLDLMMPVMSGGEVLSALRVNPEWATIPVIVLTATMGYSAEHLLADALLQKPFDSVTVQAAIETALAAKRKAPSS